METFDLITWLELIILAVWIEFGFDMSYFHLACHKGRNPSATEAGNPIQGKRSCRDGVM